MITKTPILHQVIMKFQYKMLTKQYEQLMNTNDIIAQEEKLISMERCNKIITAMENPFYNTFN